MNRGQRPISAVKPTRLGIDTHWRQGRTTLHHEANDCPIIASYSTISSLLTLFSKFFSPFLRSTCSLSVSQKYLALEEVYLPIRAAIPNNPTLWVPSYGRVVAKDWAITIYGVLFQGTYATTVLLENLSRLQFQPSAGRITNLSFSLFTRSYWGYHCYFLFLPLLICLSSGGDLANLRCRWRILFFIEKVFLF